MAAELIPCLRQAVRESHSDLVFPKPDGSTISEEVNLEDVLRRALARAGVVLGYAHVCRRKGCGHEERLRGLYPALPDPTIPNRYDCGRGGTRTHYPRLRRPVLYPDELRAQ
jgi:hypothetical protein